MLEIVATISTVVATGLGSYNLGRFLVNRVKEREAQFQKIVDLGHDTRAALDVGSALYSEVSDLKTRFLAGELDPVKVQAVKDAVAKALDTEAKKK